MNIFLEAFARIHVKVFMVDVKERSSFYQKVVSYMKIAHDLMSQ